MAYDAILDSEIEVDDAITQSLMQKIKDNQDHFNTATSGAEGFLNPSFETDADGDDEPDNWTLAAYAGGTVARDTADNAHGTASLKMVHPGGAGNGGGHATSEYVPCFEGTYSLDFLVWASVHGIRNQCIVKYYDEDKVSISSDETVWNSDGQSLTPRNVGVTFTVPSTGRFYKVQLIGGYTDTDVAGSAYFDGVRVEPNTPTVIGALANTEDVAMTENSVGSTSWTTIGTQVLTIDMIDGGVGTTELKFTAYVRSQNSSGEARIRFRIDTTYSNTIATNNTSATSGAITITLSDVTTADVTIYMEADCEFSAYDAYGKVIDADTTVEVT